MALTAYIAATNRLLQNPVPASPLYSSSDLTLFINEGRLQIAAEAECIRASSYGAITAAQATYQFSIFSAFGYDGLATGTINFAITGNPAPGDTITLDGVVWTFVAGVAVGNQTTIQGSAGLTVTVLRNDLNASANATIALATYSASSGLLGINFKTAGIQGNAFTLAASAATPSGGTLTGGFTTLTGIQSVLTVRQMSIYLSNGQQQIMTNRPWPWFQRYFASGGQIIAAGTPSTWSQQGRGVTGTFAISPLPTAASTVGIDAAFLPVALVDDSTAEALPQPFTTAVKFYAAYLAMLSSQRRDDAAVYYERYKYYVQLATGTSTPTVLPGNHPGGIGAQIAASKVTLRPQQGQR